MNIDYFLNKFENIPSHKWTVGIRENFWGQRCVLGMCNKPEEIALNKLLSALPNLTSNTEDPYVFTPARINNGEVNEYPQKDPRSRILAALEDVKFYSIIGLIVLQDELVSC